jgi:hypothetical protein
MKEQDSKAWIWPPAYQWPFLGMLWMVLMAVVGSRVATFFATFTPGEWIGCYGIAVLFGIIGVGLIFYAKLPLYRERRFFTFGARALPEERRAFYRWGYRCAVFSAALFACLWLWTR